jgi:hypothetical protein
MFGIIVSFALGALATWLVADVYYRQAGKELREEAAKLRNLMRIMLVAMQEQGWAKLNQDGSGEIIGLKFERLASDQVNVRDSATAEIERFVGQ